MAKPTSKFLLLAGFTAFAIGYNANPFRSLKKQDLIRIQAQYQKMWEYYYNGNYEGALALGQEIRKVAPNYEASNDVIQLAQRALREEKPAVSTALGTRLPASLRDSFYDAKIAFKKGECQEVKEDLRPVGRYLKNFNYLEIYENCRAKSKDMGKE